MSAMINYANEMFNAEFASNNNPELADNFDTRKESRVKLQLTLYVRRAINNIYYLRSVKTEDVSLEGARFICDLPLEVGAQLEVSGLRGQFAGSAIVRHISRTENGKWSIGINLISKKGNWVIY